MTIGLEEALWVVQEAIRRSDRPTIRLALEYEAITAIVPESVRMENPHLVARLADGNKVDLVEFLAYYAPKERPVKEISYSDLFSPENQVHEGVSLRVKWPQEINENTIRCLILDHQRDGQRELKSRLSGSGGYLIQVAESLRWCLEQIKQQKQLYHAAGFVEGVDSTLNGTYSATKEDAGGMYEPKPGKGGISPQELGHETRAQTMLIMALYGTDEQKKEVHRYLTRQEGSSFWSEEDALAVATHRHYKGGLYRVRGTSIDADTHEETIEYEHLWPHAHGRYNRKKKSWDEPLADGGVRYQPLGK